MAANLCRLLKRAMSKGHWPRPHIDGQLNSHIRLFCTDGLLGARFSDVRKQQTAQALESSHDPVSDVNTQAPDVSSIVDAALQQEDFFGVKEMVTLRDLFNARVHYGHNSGLRHESMTPYIFGTRHNSDIIDLEQTLPLLHDALNVCAHIVFRGGMVLFLSRNPQVLPWVERMAKEVKEYAHCRPWKRGTFTDASNTFGTLPIYPELCVFFNTQDSVFEMHRGIVESSKLLVPSIGIVDTNCDVTNVTYPVPANDDSPVSQHLFIDLFKRTVLRAKEKRKENKIDEALIHAAEK